MDVNQFHNEYLFWVWRMRRMRRRRGSSSRERRVDSHQGLGLAFKMK
jgi:hypothetical protein